MNKIQALTGVVRSHFFAGVMIIVPIAVIAWIFKAILLSVWDSYQTLPDFIQPRTYFSSGVVFFLDGLFIIALLVLFLVGVSFFGWASKLYLGQKALKTFGVLIQRIPILGTVYHSLDQLLKTIGTDSGQQFRRVVYVEFPRKGMWTLAFVTGSTRAPAPEGCLNIFIPMTPNPTSGFYLVVPESEVRESHLKVDQAFKVILSMGIVQPESGK